MIFSPPNRFAAALLLLAVLAGVSPHAAALDADHQAQALAAIERGVDFLRQNQNPDGSWTPEPGPAVTGLVVAVMLDQPDLDPLDPVVAKGIEYLLSRVQADGSIRDGADGILANYNTAICLSALARVHNYPEAAEAVRNAQRFLKDLQWSVGDVTPDGETITAEHPYFGGAGYGRHGRPDMSNTQVMLQGLYDSGVDCDDPAFRNAIQFISRCQGTPGNDFFPAGTIINDGGIIYATAINKDYKDIPVSYANPEQVDEARAGRPVSGLRGYGSVTYAGFKSFLYANLDRDDPRVVAALEWIGANYSLDQNPGMPEAVKLQGLYYYYMTHARALAAWGSTFLELPTQKTATITFGLQRGDQTVVDFEAKDSLISILSDKLQAEGYEIILSIDMSKPAEEEPVVTRDDQPQKIDWANNLIAKLVSLQRPDGSFVNAEARWMEDDPNLVTAYALIALQEAAR